MLFPLRAFEVQIGQYMLTQDYTSPCQINEVHIQADNVMIIGVHLLSNANYHETVPRDKILVCFSLIGKEFEVIGVKDNMLQLKRTPKNDMVSVRANKWKLLDYNYECGLIVSCKLNANNKLKDHSKHVVVYSAPRQNPNSKYSSLIWESYTGEIVP